MQTIPEAKVIHRENIHNYAIGIGLGENSKLNKIKSYSPTSESFTVEDINEFEGLKDTICKSFFF